MTRSFVADSFEVASLCSGMLVPVLYFGLQLLSAPFFPGYSFVLNAASDLGSPSSSFPALFNVGAVVMGCVTFVAALGFARAARRRSVPLLWLTALAVAAAGSSSVWAGVYPLPDPRHGANPFTVGLLLVPVLVAVTFWKERLARAMLILPVIVLAGALVVRSGVVALDTRAFEGLFQRVLALAAFAPIAVGAWLLLPRGTRRSGVSNIL
jgi:hypothetical membrane protein